MDVFSTASTLGVPEVNPKSEFITGYLLAWSVFIELLSIPE